MNGYEDIINLPHHVSATRPQMSMTDRAAQFSPFAALTGFDAAIGEAARLTDRRVELTEGEKAMLNEKTRGLMERIDEQPEITVTYFIPDSRKTGGVYTRLTGRAKKIDTCRRAILLNDGTWIPLEEITEIDVLF